MNLEVVETNQDLKRKSTLLENVRGEKVTKNGKKVINGIIKRPGKLIKSGKKQLKSGNLPKNGKTKSGIVEKNGTNLKSGQMTKNGKQQKNGMVVKHGKQTKNGVLPRNGITIKSGTMTRNGIAIKSGTMTRNGEKIQNGTITKNGEKIQNGVMITKNWEVTQHGTRMMAKHQTKAGEDFSIIRNFLKHEMYYKVRISRS